MRESAGLLGAVLVVVALVAGLSVALLGFLAQQSTDGVRSGLADRAGSDLAFRAGLPLASDADAQDAQVRDAIHGSFDPTGAVIDVTRHVDNRVVLISGLGQPEPVRGSAIVASYEDFADRAEIVDGQALAGDEEVVVQAEAARLLALELGDAVLLDGATFTVVGTWRPVDHLDPIWYGDPIVETGLRDEYGPFVIAESAWPRLEDDPRARWTLVPRADSLTAANLAEVAGVWPRIDTSWRGIVDDLSSIEKQGRFLQTARDLGIRITGLAAIQPVVIVLLVAIALVALAQLTALLSANRAGETALIWSRGASAADIARATATEIGIVALAGAVLGAAAGAGVLVLVTGGLDVVGQFWPISVLLTGGALLAAIVFAGISAFRAAAGQTVRDPGDASGRIRRFGAPGVVVLVVGAAALCVWQLQLYGSPLTPTEEGPVSVDPIAVLAPALALIAAVLTVAVAFPAIAAGADRLARRGAVTAHLATRTVARRVSVAAAPLVVVALATGSIVIGAGYAATWSDSFTRASDLRAGADLHVTSTLVGIPTEDLDAMRITPGVDGVAPVEVQPLSLGDSSGSIVAVAPDALAGIATEGGGTFDPDAAADLIRTDVPGPVIPAGADGIELAVVTAGFAVVPEISAWVVDRRGSLVRTVLEPGPGTPDSGDLLAEDAELRTWTGALDERQVTDAPRQILAIDVHVEQEAVVGDATATARLRSLTATVGDDRQDVPLEEYFLPEGPIFQATWPVGDGSGLGFTVFTDTIDTRLTPSFDGTFEDRVNPPVLISQSFADSFGLEIGEVVSFALEAGIDRLSGTVAGIVPAIPGAPRDDAILLDLTTVQHFQLRTSDVPPVFRDAWVDTDDPSAVAAELRGILPANARIQSSVDPAGRQVLGSAAAALWWGAAACGLLAIIAVTAASRAQLRTRRADIAVLRALGMSAREQAGVRSTELALILGTGLVAGLVGGGAVVLLTVPQLALAAVPQPYASIRTEVVVDLAGLAIGLGALLAALLAVVVAVRVAVGALARRAVPEGVS